MGGCCEPKLVDGGGGGGGGLDCLGAGREDSKLVLLFKAILAPLLDAVKELLEEKLEEYPLSWNPPPSLFVRVSEN